MTRYFTHNRYRPGRSPSGSKTPSPVNRVNIAAAGNPESRYLILFMTACLVFIGLLLSSCATQHAVDESSSEPQLRVSDWIWRGNYSTVIGRLNNAIEDYSRAIELAPNRQKTYFLRGKLYEKVGRKT